MDDRARQFAAATAAERVLAEFARRAAAFPELRDDADWAIVLVMAAGLKRSRPVTVGDACVGSGAPDTTALRRIRRLEQAGILRRSQDPDDGRRSLLRLSSQAEQRLVDYLA